MQYVEGATLGMLLGEQEGERLDIPAAAAVAAQVCAGLSAAHAAGLVHRDLKPENLMVRHDGVVKILDFGLVKLMADEGPPLTATGEYLGNLLYASPELLSGSPRIDGRSDLYGVGCLLHQMLTGAPPFPPAHPVLLARRHLSEEPPPIAAYGVDAPDGLQALVRALLAKEPDERPGTATEAYAALGPFLPAADPASATTRRFRPEDPRRPFLLPQAPHPV
jgi:serine/threonine protein kinase